MFFVIGCAFRGPVDIAFALDPKQEADVYRPDLWNFIRQFVSSMSVESSSEENIHFQFVHKCAEVPPLSLDQYSTKQAVLDAIDNMRLQPPGTTSLLEELVLTLNNSNQNSMAVEHNRKIGVYITDGRSEDIIASLRTAQSARFEHDIDLYGVGVGEDIDLTELTALASCSSPPRQRVFTVSNYENLPVLTEDILREICR